MNCSGHRIGTAEIESALVLHPAVAEAAVVGFPHDVKGEGIYCYVTLKDGFEYQDELRKELKSKVACNGDDTNLHLQVRAEIGAFATPDVIHWAPVLPKTRSGKIMRRILRKVTELCCFDPHATECAVQVAHNELESIGDTSTLADPDVITKLTSFK